MVSSTQRYIDRRKSAPGFTPTQTSSAARKVVGTALSLSPQVYKLLKTYAEKQGISVSELIKTTYGDVKDSVLNIIDADGTSRPIDIARNAFEGLKDKFTEKPAERAVDQIFTDSPGFDVDPPKLFSDTGMGRNPANLNYTPAEQKVISTVQDKVGNVIAPDVPSTVTGSPINTGTGMPASLRDGMPTSAYTENAGFGGGPNSSIYGYDASVPYGTESGVDFTNPNNVVMPDGTQAGQGFGPRVGEIPRVRNGVTTTNQNLPRGNARGWLDGANNPDVAAQFENGSFWDEIYTNSKNGFLPQAQAQAPAQPFVVDGTPTIDINNYGQEPTSYYNELGSNGIPSPRYNPAGGTGQRYSMGGGPGSMQVGGAAGRPYGMGGGPGSMPRFAYTENAGMGGGPGSMQVGGGAGRPYGMGGGPGSIPANQGFLGKLGSSINAFAPGAILGVAANTLLKAYQRPSAADAFRSQMAYNEATGSSGSPWGYTGEASSLNPFDAAGNPRTPRMPKYGGYTNNRTDGTQDWNQSMGGPSAVDLANLHAYRGSTTHTPKSAKPFDVYNVDNEDYVKVGPSNPLYKRMGLTNPTGGGVGIGEYARHQMAYRNEMQDKASENRGR